MMDVKSPRVVADREMWEVLRRAKLGPCRVCSDDFLPQLHHLVARSLGGDDVAANLVPLCGRCHAEVEAHAELACRALQLSLTDAELVYITEAKYAGYVGRRYGKDAA